MELLGVENADLAIAADELARGKLRDWETGEIFQIQCGMTALEGLFSAGPTHDLIGHLPGREPIGAFEFHPLEDGRMVGKDLSLWAANCKTQKHLLVQPTHKGIEVRKELAMKMRQKKSKHELAKLELRPACQAHCDESRKRIDETVFKMLSIPPRLTKTIDKMRRLWCEEPSVHDNNKTALKLLGKSGN